MDLQARKVDANNGDRLCLSIGSKESLRNTKSCQYPATQKHYPKAMSILVGTKLDLRENTAAGEELEESAAMHCEGVHMAEKIKEIKYL